MKDFPGIPFAALPDVNSPDFVSRLRNMLATIDGWGRDASVAFGRIQAGQVPSASGSAALGYTSGDPRNAGVSQVQPAPGSSGDIQQWRTANGTLVMSLGPTGILVYSQIQSGSGNFIISGSGILVCTGIAVGPNSGVTNLLIQADGSLTCTSINVGSGILLTDSGGVLDILAIKSSGTGNIGTLDWGGIASGAVLTLPSATSNILSDTNSVSVSNKTLVATGNNLRCNTSTGVTFQDSSSTTKQMRFDLSGVTAATTRAQKWQDVAGSVVTVGNTTSASGVLGTIALAAQTGNLSAQTLLTGNASSAGLYRVSFYLKCSTAGTAGSNVTATLAWNEGTAQTMVVAFLGGGGTNSNTVPYVAHDLGTASTFSEASVVVKVSASQNITFTTTITIVGGSPAYNLDARVESLG